MGRDTYSSSSSSIDSSNHPTLSSASSFSQPKRDLSTDLRLGLSMSTSPQDSPSSPREQPSDWPPIKQLLRRALGAEGKKCNDATFFVKVYMEGIPIGRKLDLFAHNGYHALIATLDHMFGTTILWAGVDRVHSGKCHVLTYEDREGDWMMVGDVPWEMFLTTVKRLKITRADTC